MTYFNKNASFNQPWKTLGQDTSPLVADWPTRLAKWGGGPRPEAQQFVLNTTQYSVPIYKAEEATGTARCYQTVWSQNQQQFGNRPIGTTIPWNPAWKPAGGSDRIMAIVSKTGEAWYLWGVGEPGFNCFDWWGPNGRAGWLSWNGNKQCMASLVNQKNIFTATELPAGPPLVNARGMGIDKLALVVTANEIDQQLIPHAIPITTANPAYTLTHRRPATKTEYTTLSPPRTGLDGTNLMPPEQTLPTGTRIAYTQTNAEIEQILDNQNLTGPLRTTGRTLWKALNDYGAIIAETGGWGIGIETEGLTNPQTHATWARNGITPTRPATNLLNVPLNPQKIIIIKQP